MWTYQELAQAPHPIQHRGCSDHAITLTAKKTWKSNEIKMAPGSWQLVAASTELPPQGINQGLSYSILKASWAANPETLRHWHKEVIIEKSALISFPVKPLQIRQSLCVTGLFSYLELVIGCNVSKLLKKNWLIWAYIYFIGFKSLFLDQIQHCPVRTFRTFLSLFGICTRGEKHTQKSSTLLCCEQKCQMGGGGYSRCVLELCDTTSTSLRLWSDITGADLCSRGHVKARPAPKRIPSLNVSAVATWRQNLGGGETGRDDLKHA